MIRAPSKLEITWQKHLQKSTVNIILDHETLTALLLKAGTHTDSDGKAGDNHI